MNQRIDSETKVDVVLFEIMENDPNETKDELLHRIREFIDNIPSQYKVPGEDNMIALRMFTKRC